MFKKNVLMKLKTMKKAVVYTEQNEPCKAAGALLYQKSGNQTFFLLINRNGRYEDFGGRVEVIDNTVIDTVAREVVEESNGVINNSFIRSLLNKRGPVLHSPISQYFMYFRRVHESVIYKPEFFGDCEIHDNIVRTVEWVSKRELLSIWDVKGKIHPRIKSNRAKRVIGTL